MYFTNQKTIIVLNQPILIENIVYSAVDNEGTYYTLRELKRIEKNPNAMIYNEQEYYDSLDNSWQNCYYNYFGMMPMESATDHFSYYYEV